MDIIFVLAVAIFIEKSCSQTLNTPPTCYGDGSEIELECITTDHTEAIYFWLDGVNKGGCAGICASNITQSGTTTTYTLTFISSTHSGNWTCSYGAFKSPIVIIAANPCVETTMGSIEGEVSKVTKAIEERSDKVVEKTLQGDAGGSGGVGLTSGTIQKLARVKFTIPVAKRWYFSNQYKLRGTVVYGIQIVLVSAVSNTVTIAIVVGVLVYYYGQIKCITIFYLFLLTAAFSIVGVLIYMLILVFFGDKDHIHIKFKKKKESIKLSAHGMKPIKDNNICIYFKVKAIYASITLHIIENMEEHDVNSKPTIRPLKRVLLLDHKEDSNDLNHLNAIHTEYQAFYLKCENETITITVFDGKYKQIEQWTISADSFKIADIEISNIKQDASAKDVSTKDASAKDASTKDASTKDASTKDNSTEDNSTKDNKKLDTTDEWIFWFREGDTLCEIEEHERKTTENKRDILRKIEEHDRKTTENKRCKQTLLLICVIILPIAWLVMIVLMLRNCIKSKGKNTDNTNLEMGEKLNKDQKESSGEHQDKKQKGTKGKWFDFTSFSCCHNSVKPNSTTDNKPKALKGHKYSN